MRKIVESLAVAVLAALWGVTVFATGGPDRLPPRIPTHFNLAGQPDGWGTPGMLYMLPVIGTAIYLLMTLVSRFPASFNFPMRVRPGERAQMEQIALNMIAWIKAEVVCLLLWIQYGTIRIIRQGQGRLSPIAVPLIMVAVFGTIGWHIVRMRRVARSVR